ILSHDEGIKIIQNLREQLILNKKLEVKNSTEMNMLLDSLTLMENYIEDGKTQKKLQEDWNSFSNK
ncbi:hypothetical protein, partial [Clostridium perfringens]